jgi:endonuclease G
MNQGEWADLESTVRDRVRLARAGWIFTGNLVLGANGQPTTPTTRIGGNDVVVPTHCFKALLLLYPGDAVRMAGFLMPNQPGDIGRWFTSNESVDTLEDLTGLDFFDDLPDAVEGEIEALNWSL